jgi:hypothetical protein
LSPRRKQVSRQAYPGGLRLPGVQQAND